ncbi:MAG TPA: glutamate synthase [Candidatus Dormibacteraeota bacterium]|nr:glutamate synthase [Candidatus Dormibacteraeota bacterium]
MGQLTSTATIDLEGLTTREANVRIRNLIDGGAREIAIDNPRARHALAPAIKAEDVTLDFRGPVGWYAAGMNDGPRVRIHGNAGWGLAECMMRGQVEVYGHAGSGAAASIRGGLVYVRGDTGARAGVSMKGGTLIVGGSVGYMTGFMLQAGTIIICGGAGDGLGDSMYAGTIYVAGPVESLGADAEEHPLSQDDKAILADTLKPFGLDAGNIPFRKVESGHRLWNFSTKEPELWRHAL